VVCFIVDGNWAEWGPWSEPSRSCGGATKRRVRSCSNPVPEYGGKDCEGEAEEVQECNTEACPGMNFKKLIFVL